MNRLVESLLKLKITPEKDDDAAHTRNSTTMIVIIH